MPVVVIVGTQWGDEGKGKVVDYYASQVDIVVRYQGGNNAGHTVIVGNRTHKFHLLPSGAASGKTIVIGNGVVIDPGVLLQELQTLNDENVKLKISSLAHVIFPYHRELDGLEEQAKGKWAAGTTKRGIGPAYTDKVARFGIRMGELINPVILEEKLRTLIPLKQKQLQVYDPSKTLDPAKILQEYTEYGQKLAPFVTDTASFLNQHLDSHRILLEGAQGTLLDIDHGVYPYGTSSNTTAGGACTGTGIGPTRISAVIGVMKAYLSRVGPGPVITEITDQMAHTIREKGHEYGTTTGRPRRIGWLDLVAVKYAIAINGITGLAVTRLDTLAGLKSIKICTHYQYNGQDIDTMPLEAHIQEKCLPVYHEITGWEDQDWATIAQQGYSALPSSMKEFLQLITDFLGTKLVMVSIGAERSATIQLEPLFPA